MHRPGSIMTIPREWSLLYGFIMYLGVTRNGQHSSACLELGPCRSDLEAIKEVPRACFPVLGLPGETGASLPNTCL